jgi:ABC-2 type transport system ATP-binding protein
MITATDLSRSFGSGRNRATPLRGVSHTFRDGAVTYLVGLNGTGKSTLLRLLCGVLHPDSGTVIRDGRSGTGSVGMLLSADAARSGHTGRRHLHWVAAALGVPSRDADRMIGAVGLGNAADTPVGSYSLGMRQRLGIGTALLGSPDNIILDEPLNGLDVAGMLWLRSLIRRAADAGHCVIIASHHLAEVERAADDVLVLEQGHVVASGAVAEVRGHHRSLEDAYIDLVPRASDHEVAR